MPQKWALSPTLRTYGLHSVHRILTLIAAMEIGSSMIRNRTPKHNSGYWATMSFDKALWKVAFTGRASNTNEAIMVPQIEA
ncbi:hypothetical protein TNCV_1271531 [Trichonephila clavipes]|nr:hypothetical protein TNCV_1271531 [Trichonephila clavipes]